jgi:hypothetical protein
LKTLIEPISRALLKSELKKDLFVRNTRKGDNEIYILDHFSAPNTLLEIGRLREITFRASGGGTGDPLDIDDFDTHKNCYQQLIVWSPEDEEIIGGYRFIKCANAIDENGKIHLSTAHYFNFNTEFTENYLAKTIELGRSWVQPNFQPNINPRKGLFALDNIWDGLGAIVILNPEINYLFGKVTMYPNYNLECRDFLLYFLDYYFPDREELMRPFHPLLHNKNKFDYSVFLQNLDFKEGIKVLNSYLRERGEFIPPLINIYMGLSPSMKTFGTAINSDFGNVEETGIMVTISDIYPEKKERHMDF